MQGVTHLAGVPDGAPQSRNETSEAQAMEIELRPSLLISERSRDEPAFSGRQFQTARQALTPNSKFERHFADPKLPPRFLLLAGRA